MVKQEGTYLVWLDFRGLDITAEELEDLIVNRARLWLDSGRDLRGGRQRIPEDQCGMSEGSVRGNTDEVRVGSRSVETGSIPK